MMGSQGGPVARLLRRRDFVAAARGRSCAMPGLVLQSRDRADQEPPRVGFTATTKLGNAVARNRVKRRLREAARLVMPAEAAPGHDYVLIGRQGTASRPFADLQSDLATALKRLKQSPHKSA